MSESLLSIVAWPTSAATAVSIPSACSPVGNAKLVHAGCCGCCGGCECCIDACCCCAGGGGVAAGATVSESLLSIVAWLTSTATAVSIPSASSACRFAAGASSTSSACSAGRLTPTTRTATGGTAAAAAAAGSRSRACACVSTMGPASACLRSPAGGVLLAATAAAAAAARLFLPLFAAAASAASSASISAAVAAASAAKAASRSCATLRGCNSTAGSDSSPIGDTVVRIAVGCCVSASSMLWSTAFPRARGEGARAWEESSAAGWSGAEKAVNEAGATSASVGRTSVCMASASSGSAAEQLATTTEAKAEGGGGCGDLPCTSWVRGVDCAKLCPARQTRRSLGNRPRVYHTSSCATPTTCASHGNGAGVEESNSRDQGVLEARPIGQRINSTSAPGQNSST